MAKHPSDAECNVRVHQLDSELSTNVIIPTLSSKLLQSPHLNDCPTLRLEHFLAIIEPLLFPNAVLVYLVSPETAALPRVLY